jgi:hypothetical protein
MFLMSGWRIGNPRPLVLQNSTNDMLITNPDLDDKILHYVLVGVGVLVYHFFKTALDRLGVWEWKWIERLLKKKRKTDL